MKARNRRLMIEQLDKKLMKYTLLLITDEIPKKGWINAIRTVLGMSFRQFGGRMGITPQGAEQLEKREKEGNITLKSLEEAGRALNMKLVYGFVPLEGSIEKTIEKRARELALDIVKSTSNTMALEDQKNSDERLEKAVENKTKELIYEIPRYLWD